MKKIRKINKFYKYFLGVVAFSFTPIFLSSCSSSVSSDLIDDSVSKGSGDYFASQISLSDVAKEALSNQTSASSFFDQEVGELVLS